MSWIALTAGPLFVVLALGLISMCAFMYFDIVLPHYFSGNEPLSFQGGISKILLISFAVYLLVMIGFHYFMAVTTSPNGPHKV